jgi:hypothetical protein
MIKYLDAIRLREPTLDVSPEGVVQVETGNPYGMGWWFIGKLANCPTVFHDGANNCLLSRIAKLIHNPTKVLDEREEERGYQQTKDPEIVNLTGSSC